MGRPDGKKVKNVESMYAIMPYIMVERNDALNYITEHFEYKPMHDYIIKKRKEGIHLSHMDIIMAAYVRVLAEYPWINRFIVNKKIYARNEISVDTIILRPGSPNATSAKVYLERTDTVFDVNEKFQKLLEEKRSIEEDNSMDKIIKFFLAVPPLTGFVIGTLKWMDKHGWLPKKIIDISPFHSSLIISNLASIRTTEIYHHIYNFGTTSLFITIGKSIKRPVEDKDGNIIMKRYMPIGVAMDERICSGSYFAKVFRRLEEYITNPELLETPTQIINEDY